MLKKIFIFLFGIFISFLISFKIEASDLKYCSYNENLNLALPVTIHVAIEANHPFYPFSEKEPLYYDISYFVYDKETCQNEISLPYIDEEYEITLTHFYQYNNNKILSNYSLNKGVYYEKDLTPPVFKVSSNQITTSVDACLSLDEITNYISAYDQVDGKIIPEITYDNYTNNSNKIGTYSIVFEAFDKSNNFSNYTLFINVIDYTPPIIRGENNFIFPLSSAPTINDISLNLSAIDNYDGNLTHKIYSLHQNYNPNTPGTYYIYFTVKDSSNNELQTPFKTTIKIFDDIAPTIEGPTLFTSPLSSALETKNILSNMIVHDNFDSNIYNNLYIIDDNYTKNKDRIGEYSLILGCYDSNKNESLPYIVTIKVIDDVAPIIDGIKIFNSYLSSPITISEIKSNILALDNHDGNLINKIELLQDNYSSNQSNIGIYTLTFSVTDSSLNVSEPFLVEIIVHDDIAPIIEGENLYRTLLTNKININNILLSLSASDNIDGDISDKIILYEDTYSDNYDFPGTYFVTFNVCDSSLNYSNQFKIKIIVQEELTLLQKLDNSYISFDTSRKRTDVELFDILGIDHNSYAKITTLENNYDTNYNEPGIYTIKFKFEDHSYNKEYLNLNISTYLDNTVKNSRVSNEKKETIFQKIISFFTTLFSKTINWFKKLF